MTNKGANKKRPALTASTAGTYLSVVNIGNASVPKVPWHLTKSTVSRRVCWSLKVVWGNASADFRQFQIGGEGKKKERYGIDRKSESK